MEKIRTDDIYLTRLGVVNEFWGSPDYFLEVGTFLIKNCDRSHVVVCTQAEARYMRLILKKEGFLDGEQSPDAPPHFWNLLRRGDFYIALGSKILLSGWRASGSTDLAFSATMPMTQSEILQFVARSRSLRNENYPKCRLWLKA